MTRIKVSSKETLEITKSRVVLFFVSATTQKRFRRKEMERHDWNS